MFIELVLLLLQVIIVTFTLGTVVFERLTVALQIGIILLELQLKLVIWSCFSLLEIIVHFINLYNPLN